MNSSMLRHPLTLKIAAGLMFTAAAAMSGSLASAQSLTAAEAQQRYQQDMERCRTSGLSPEDERTCRREAGAALEEARRNRLVTGPATFDDNQRARCDRLTGVQREDCLRLMSDPNAVVHGSVEGGGIIRETTITIPADPTNTAPGATVAPVPQ